MSSERERYENRDKVRHNETKVTYLVLWIILRKKNHLGITPILTESTRSEFPFHVHSLNELHCLNGLNQFRFIFFEESLIIMDKHLMGAWFTSKLYCMIELRGAQGLYIPSQSLQNRAIAYSSCYENFGVIIEEHLRVQGQTKSSVVHGFSMQPLPLQRRYTIDRTSVGYCSLDLVSCKSVYWTVKALK